MLFSVSIHTKTIANKQLFQELQFSIATQEKVAIIGRNGVGKTTLFRMLTGEDHNYQGDITFRKGVRVVATRQEHHEVGAQTAVEYIIANLPEYQSLHHIITTYPETMSDDVRKIQTYTDALERFSSLDYYTVEDRIRRSLADYQLDHMADQPLAQLSGGQKRFVELIRVEYSDADVALIDEPTNHMDYVAKAAFIKWFSTVKHGVVVITHDRDLLQHVNRIIEIKDMAAFSFEGNYKAYLQQNALRTTTELHDYEVGQRRIANVKKQIAFARSKKAGWSGTADKKNPFVVMENRLLKELKTLEAENERPTFWIDKVSVTELKPTIEASYHKHKARAIQIRQQGTSERQRELLSLEDVQVGYDRALFLPLTTRIQNGDRVQIVGRNGAGKTTLVHTIQACLTTPTPATLLHGKITLDTKLRSNTYEQEIDNKFLSMTLGRAIENVYASYGLSITVEHIMRTLSNYLFDPYQDLEQIVSTLSGGQKARLQLIKMFANQPNLLILDEPTNHLDLPSIEELEATLAHYKGALLYISHDSYLSRQLGGEQLNINSV